MRNHRALGIFTPVNNTVAVDFRSDENGMIEKGIGKKNIGLQSLIHEYGHFLDYNMLCDSAALSLSGDFDNILFQTQAELRANSKRLALMGEKKLNIYVCLVKFSQEPLRSMCMIVDLIIHLPKIQNS